MKKIATLLTLALVVVILVPAAGVLANGGTEICVGNIGDGVTGGTEHDFCSDTPGEEDEWHFIITSISEANAPAFITAVFQTAGEVVIPLEGVTGGAAHYRLEAQYLTDTLLSVCGMLPAGIVWDGNFNLSHAPCIDSGSSTGGEVDGQLEVGGTVYPVNRAVLLAPWIALAVIALAGTVLLAKRIHVRR